MVRGDGEADVIGHGWDVAFGVAVPAEAKLGNVEPTPAALISDGEVVQPRILVRLNIDSLVLIGSRDNVT